MEESKKPQILSEQEMLEQRRIEALNYIVSQKIDADFYRRRLFVEPKSKELMDSINQIESRIRLNELFIKYLEERLSHKTDEK